MVSGDRVSKMRTFHLVAPPSRVFPLLCPIREYEWVEGWSCELIHSTTGYAEPGCIFTSRLDPEGLAVWIITDHQPDTHMRVIKTCADLYLLEWTFDLGENGQNWTDLQMVYTMTGLSEAGNTYARQFMNGIFPLMMDRLEEELNHFLNTEDTMKTSSEVSR